MPLLFIYLLKVSISLTVAWLFYQLVLRRLTFYSWNRWYLMGYTILCFFIPFINVQQVVDSSRFRGQTIIRYIPVFHSPDRDHSWELVFTLFAAGAVILLIRLFIGWLSVRKIRGQARLIRHISVDGAGDVDRMPVYQVDERIVPFSFGNAIYINQALHTEKEYQEIILHEYVHIRQRHSVDILLAELLCALCWYNPFAWLIRHSIRQNLEFIADGKVLEKGFDRKGYQYHLLKVIGEPRYRLANNFNFYSLKKRIVMMNKIRSARLQLVKFLFVLPLLAVLLLAFRGEMLRSGGVGLKAVGIKEKPGKGIKDSVSGNQAAGMVRVEFRASPRHFKSTVPITEVNDSVPKIMEDLGKGGSSTAGTKTEGPLIYVDGVEQPNGALNHINPMDIVSINVLKGKDAASYGERGMNGVLLITTKAGQRRQEGSASSAPRNIDITMDSNIVIINASKDSVIGYIMHGQKVNASIGSAQAEPTSLRVADSFKGLILLDGKEISRSTLQSLNPLKIKVYSVLSGDEAVKRYGERASQGALVIDSK